MSIDTGFDLHVCLPVDFDGQRPNPGAVHAAKDNLAGCAKWKGGTLHRLTEKWFNVAGQGYDRDWMWVIGAKWRIAPPPNAPKLADEMAQRQ